MRTFWSLFFSIFFLALMGMGLQWLIEAELITWIAPWEFFLLALAIFRLIRLFAYDHITQFLRDWLGQSEPNTFLGTLSQLVNCPWCIGLWFSYLVVFAYFATPYAWPLILILALASVASFFQILTNLIGWHAEGKKKQVQGK